MLKTQLPSDSMDKLAKKLKRNMVTFFRKSVNKGVTMIDQNIKWTSKNIAVSQFFTRDNTSSYQEEYEAYQNTMEDFGFEQFSEIKNIPLVERDKEDESKEMEIKDTDINESISTPTMITVKEMKNKHPLNLDLVIESAKNLNIEGIVDENSLIEIDNVQKIVLECNKINAEKANANNPMHNSHIKNSPRTTMGELMREHNVSLNELRQITNALGIPNILNKNSYASDYNIERIVTALNKKNTANSYFETLLQQDYKVFIDSCSLMNDNMPEMLEHTIIPLLEQYNSVVYITDSVIHEINTKLKSHSDMETYNKAKSARNILERLNEKDLYQVPETGSVNKYFADAELISIFTDLRLKYKMCLITNDNKHSNKGGLAGSIMKLNEDPNIHSINDIKVFSVNSKKGISELIEYDSKRDSNFTLHENAPLRVKL